MLTLYARREPATDSVLLEYTPDGKRYDVVLYKDKAMTEIKARWAWYKSPPTKRNKYVTLNGFTWRIIWA